VKDSRSTKEGRKVAAVQGIDEENRKTIFSYLYPCSSSFELSSLLLRAFL
jgi:hypothetical protein